MIKLFLYKKRIQYQRYQFLKQRRKEGSVISAQTSGYWKVFFEGKNGVPERCQFLSDNIRIGYATTLGVNNLLSGNVTIGKYCQIGADVAFHASNHPISHMTTYINSNLFNGELKKFKEEHKITVGNDVWVGHGVIVVGNVTIGNGAILAAGSVITKDVAPYTIVAGIPAKFIRKRFSDKIIQEIEDLKWWDLPNDELEKIKPLFLKILPIKKVFMTTKPYLIAEIGQAHEGSLGILHSYIDALASTGVQAIKFQMHIAEAESSSHEPFRIKFSYEDDTRYDYWERMGFTLEQWKGIKKHCDEVGLDFVCSPFSNMAVDWLEEIGVNQYKIGSGEVSNWLLLEKIAQTGKPIIISSGMSSYEELDKTVAFLKERKVSFSLLQCTTSYPTQPEQYGLNVIQELKDRYQIKIGFSDHSSKIATNVAAVALGAEILEFHVVFDRRMFGPDSKSSLTIDEVSKMVIAVNDIYKALQHPIDKNQNEEFSTLKSIFEKSLAVNKNLPKGHQITFDDLEAKKPKGFGIDAMHFEEVIGKTLNKDFKKWDF